MGPNPSQVHGTLTLVIMNNLVGLIRCFEQENYLPEEV